MPAVDLSKAQSAAAGCYSDTQVMCPLDWTLRIPNYPSAEAGYRYLSCLSDFRAPTLPLPKAPAARQPIPSDPPAGARQLPG